MSKDGGPAFPIETQYLPDHVAAEKTGKLIEGYPGMSLRDWYAGMALQGMCANPEICKDAKGDFDDGDAVTKVYAEISYRHADAMIKERDNV